jgi:anti-sigma B factor antagonist
LNDDGTRDLGLDVTQDHAAATIRVNGELQRSTAPEFLWTCRSLYERGARDVVVDLADTSFLDSSGLRALILARGLFGEDGGTLRLARPIEPVLRMLELSGLAAAGFMDEPGLLDDDVRDDGAPDDGPV